MLKTNKQLFKAFLSKRQTARQLKTGTGKGTKRYTDRQTDTYETDRYETEGERWRGTDRPRLTEPDKHAETDIQETDQVRHRRRYRVHVHV